MQIKTKNKKACAFLFEHSRTFCDFKYTSFQMFLLHSVGRLHSLNKKSMVCKYTIINYGILFHWFNVNVYVFIKKSLLLFMLTIVWRRLCTVL